MQRRPIARIALATLVVAAVSCASVGPEEGSVAPAEEWSEAPPLDGSDRITGSEIPERMPDLTAVYFDFDMALIRADQKPTLRGNANTILDHSGWTRITIEGHCDERGSEEYNLALGERRAHAVKRYLVNLGIADSRIDTVSFGESKPAVQGHDESAWRWNRRAEFRIVQ